LQKYHSTIWDVLLPESVDQEAMLNSYDVSMMAYAELHGVELPPIEQQVYGLAVNEVTGNSALLTWSSAKSGQMDLHVTGDEGDVVDETWVSSSSDHVYVISGMDPGQEYTVTISAEGVSVSASFTTPSEVDTEAPEILGAEYEVDEGAYHLSFFTTEPSSIVIEVCTEVSCSPADIGNEADYPTEQVHRYSLAVPEGNHTVTIHAMDVAGNDGSMLLIESGTISDTQVNNGTQNGNGTAAGGNDGSSEANSLVVPLILVVIALAAAILVLQGTRKPSSGNMEDGPSDAEIED
jgi:hypothetical protein